MQKNLVSRGNSRMFFAVLIAALSAVALPAHAVIDITAATTGISDASVAVLAVIAAMITMGVAVWGVRKVLRFFGR